MNNVNIYYIIKKMEQFISDTQCLFNERCLLNILFDFWMPLYFRKVEKDGKGQILDDSDNVVYTLPDNEKFSFHNYTRLYSVFIRYLQNGRPLFFNAVTHKIEHVSNPSFRKPAKRLNRNASHTLRDINISSTENKVTIEFLSKKIEFDWNPDFVFFNSLEDFIIIVYYYIGKIQLYLFAHYSSCIFTLDNTNIITYGRNTVIIEKEGILSEVIRYNKYSQRFTVIENVENGKSMLENFI